MLYKQPDLCTTFIHLEMHVYLLSISSHIWHTRMQIFEDINMLMHKILALHYGK